jgi:hypothetical protein
VKLHVHRFRFFWPDAAMFCEKVCVMVNNRSPLPNATATLRQITASYPRQNQIPLNKKKTQRMKKLLLTMRQASPRHLPTLSTTDT